MPYEPIDHGIGLRSLGRKVGIRDVMEPPTPHGHISRPVCTAIASSIDNAANILGGERAAVRPRCNPRQIGHSPFDEGRDRSVTETVRTMAARAKAPIKLRA